ncbi:hypothetical protein G9A89_016308 [Geosiphon pyriformis]|nr:hypothetical protein G9A89_016308 [Geosiphon pyriformis]
MSSTFNHHASFFPPTITNDEEKNKSEPQFHTLPSFGATRSLPNSPLQVPNKTVAPPLLNLSNSNHQNQGHFLSVPSSSLATQDDDFYEEEMEMILPWPTESPHIPPIERPNTPSYTQKTTHLSQLEPDSTSLWGWALLFASFIMFVTSMYAIVVSKFIPETGNRTLDWIKRDEYYCLLVPITLSVTNHSSTSNFSKNFKLKQL